MGAVSVAPREPSAWRLQVVEATAPVPLWLLVQVTTAPPNLRFPERSESELNRPAGPGGLHLMALHQPSSDLNLNLAVVVRQSSVASATLRLQVQSQVVDHR